MKDASNNEGKKMQAFTHTFNEIIKRDKNFGSLLLKIKQAYDDYIRKTAQGMQSPCGKEGSKPSYEDLESKLMATEMELNSFKVRYEEGQRQLIQVRTEMEHNIEALKAENEKLQSSVKSLHNEN